MKEFQINEFLSLKLENDETIIYVAGKSFMSCKYLLFNIRKNNFNEYDDIESIDEAVKFFHHKNNENNVLLNPKTEFWGHCSNLQAWAEHNYDTRLLDMRLAFPLLKKLTDSGEPIAKKVFKEEIAKRLLERIPSIEKFLISEGYMNYLSSFKSLLIASKK